MKKLLVLLLVLGLTTAASATLQISVNGEPAPPDSEITLDKSEILELDIYTDAFIPQYVENHTWALVVGPAGAIAGGVNVSPNPADTVGPYALYLYPVPVPPGTDGIAGATLAQTPAGIPAGTVLVNEIEFHYMDSLLPDVVVYLVETVDWVSYDIVDQVVIHTYVPEPMTLSLFGVGGFALLRRRRY